MMRIHIHGGRVIDPANGLDKKQDVYIAEGKIAAVGQAPDGFSTEQQIDATGLIVCPGLIDLRARLREPGEEHKGTIASETRAAAAGGITTLCCPPDTLPVIDTPAVATLIRDRAAAAGLADVLPLGALTRKLGGERLTEMRALADAGCPGVSNDLNPMRSLQVLRRAMEYAASHNLVLFVNAEEHSLRDSGCVHEGAVSTRLGLPGIPEAAETAAVATTLALVDQTGARTHFSMLTTARAAKMVGRARYDGLPVSADVSAHHLHLTDMDILDFDSQCHVLPPLRTRRDQEALRTALKQDIISAICSDHAPHEADAKLAPFTETSPGISALETLLPLTLRLVDDGILTLPEAIASLTSKPAGILDRPVGRLSTGMRADICILDPEKYWTLTPQTLHSRGHNTPFLDWELKGQVTHTLLAGRLIHEHGEILG